MVKEYLVLKDGGFYYLSSFKVTEYDERSSTEAIETTYREE